MSSDITAGSAFGPIWANLGQFQEKTTRLLACEDRRRGWRDSEESLNDLTFGPRRPQSALIPRLGQEHSWSRRPKFQLSGPARRRRITARYYCARLCRAARFFPVNNGQEKKREEIKWGLTGYYCARFLRSGTRVCVSNCVSPRKKKRGFPREIGKRNFFCA